MEISKGKEWIDFTFGSSDPQFSKPPGRERVKSALRQDYFTLYIHIHILSPIQQPNQTTCIDFVILFQYV